MLKSLGFFAVVAAYLLWWPSVSKGQQPTSQAADNKPGQHKRVVPPTHVVIDPPLPTPPSQPESTPAQQTSPEKPLPRFERPEWVIVYVTIVYALIAWLTLRTIKRQANLMEQQATDARKASADSAKFATDTLEEMKAQRLQMAGAMGKQAYEMGEQSAAVRSSARAAEEGAKAALLNAQSLISAERAWVLASIRKTVLPFPYTTMLRMPDTVTCELIFKNYGATPAIIESFSCQTQWTIPKFDFSLPPEYGERKEARIILAPQEEKVIGTVFPVEQLPDFPIDRTLFTIERAVFMGYVNYGGIFDGQRETKFCFGFDRENDSFIPIGPAAYNDAT
jgi:hypothetical protein